MKNQRIAALLLVLVMLVTMSACGSSKLSGTYTSHVDNVLTPSGEDITMTFDGDNVTMSIMGNDISGTYKIEGDKIIMNYSLFGSDQSVEQSFAKSGDTITIGGSEFVKQ